MKAGLKSISILIGSFALASCSLPVTLATTKAKPESRAESSVQAKTVAPIELPIEPKTEAPIEPNIGAQAEQKRPPEGLVFAVTRATTSESRALLSARLLKMNASSLHWYNDTGVVSLVISPPFMDALKSDPDVALILSDKMYDGTPRKQTAPVIQTSPSPTVKAPLPVEKPVAPLKPPAPQPIPPLEPVPVASSPPAPAAAAAPLVTSALPAATAFQPFALNQFPPVAMNQTPMPMIGGATPMPGAIPGSMPGSTIGGLAMPGMGLMDSLAGGVVQKFFNRPASCKITITKAAATFSADGGDGMFEVKASGSCAWQAQATVPWIQILSGTGVSGSGIVTYHVSRAEGILRSGAISLVATAAGSAIKGNASQVVTQRP
jgi:hypothetical protein